MKLKPLISLTLVLLCASSTHAQGWQQLGPDSLNWRGVGRLTGRWLSPATYHLAAVTAKGIAIYDMQPNWNYVLRNVPPDMFHLAVFYRYLKFSPWEPDSIFIGYDVHYTEGSPRILKYPFPVVHPPGSFGGANVGGDCWFSPISLSIPPNSDSVVYAGVCGIHRSEDRGSHWATILSEVPWALSKLLGTDAHDGSILYRSREGFESDTLFRSTNEGITWDSIFLAPLTQYDKALIADGDTILFSLRLWPNDTSNVKGIYRSTDAGVSWTHAYNASGVADLVVSRVTLNTFYAAAEAGILKSTDFGQTWTIYNNGLPTTSVTSMIISPYSDTLYVSTETHGVLKVWDFITDVADSRDFIPHEFVLAQNYPNPFNPSTTIRYELPVRALVALKVYNILGQEVATLVSEEREAGTHRVQFDGTGLASGVYLYRLRAGDYFETKKLVLLK